MAVVSQNAAKQSRISGSAGIISDAVSVIGHGLPVHLENVAGIPEIALPSYPGDILPGIHVLLELSYDIVHLGLVLVHLHNVALVIEAMGPKAQEGGADDSGNDDPRRNAGSDKLVFRTGGVVNAHAGGDLGAGEGAVDPEVQEQGFELHFRPDNVGGAIQNAGVDPEAEDPQNKGQEMVAERLVIPAELPDVRSTAVGQIHDNAGNAQLHKMSQH